MADISFIRNKKTGIVEAWKNGMKIGVITTMGDELKPKTNGGNKDGRAS